MPASFANLPRGVIMVGETATMANDLSIDELSEFVSKTCQNCISSSGCRYRPHYMQQMIMAYMISGSPDDFKYISRDRGLSEAVRILRERLQKGERSVFGYES